MSKINRKYSQNSKPTYRDGTGNYLYRGRQPFCLKIICQHNLQKVNIRLIK